MLTPYLRGGPYTYLSRTPILAPSDRPFPCETPGVPGLRATLDERSVGPQHGLDVPVRLGRSELVSLSVGEEDRGGSGGEANVAPPGR